MGLADLVVVTGSQDTVQRAYRSGTPAIGVGPGNVPVIVDESADLEQAARLIAQSKTFDNGSSCSSESAVIILDAVYEEMMEELSNAGGHLASPAEEGRLRERFFRGGMRNREFTAQDFSVLCDLLDLEASVGSKFVMVEDDTPGPGNPMSMEKISLVPTIYRARGLEHSVDMAKEVLEVAGMGHSAGIHTRHRSRSLRLAEALPVARVLVNQAHSVGNGGAFDNRLPFTLTMGCGTWAGNSICENLSIDHFLNVSRHVETREWDEPTPSSLFSQHWERTGESGSGREGCGVDRESSGY